MQVYLILVIFFSVLIDLKNENSFLVEIQAFGFIDFCYVLFNKLEFYCEYYAKAFDFNSYNSC